MAKVETSSGFGIGTLLGVVFITLKLCDKIDWSWWWVLSPFWISGVIFLMVVAVIIAVAIASECSK